MIKYKMSAFQKKAIKEMELTEEVSHWKFKELGDHLIQENWSKEKFGSLNSVVLNRVINILFKIGEQRDNK